MSMAGTFSRSAPTIDPLESVLAELTKQGFELMCADNSAKEEDATSVFAGKEYNTTDIFFAAYLPFANSQTKSSK